LAEEEVKFADLLSEEKSKISPQATRANGSG
jgi:hypothetical protein